MAAFSVVLPTYNRSDLVRHAIESVIGQNCKDWELIVVDDGSTDNTREIVAGFGDPRIRYVFQTNQERSAARNKGISLASGKFICFLDSDDRWRNNHLQLLHETILIHGESPGLYFTGMCWNFPGKKTDVVFESPSGKNQVEYVIVNQIGTPTTCIHRSILEIHQFRTDLRINEDVELFSRIAASNELIQIPVCTVDVLVHGQNTKAREKDYITPQIHALKIIFKNPQLKNKLSRSFKRERLRNLRHQLINHFFRAEEYSKMNLEIIRFLLTYPFDYQNKSRIVLLLYHLPGGSLIRQLVNTLKSKS